MYINCRLLSETNLMWFNVVIHDKSFLHPPNTKRYVYGPSRAYELQRNYTNMHYVQNILQCVEP